MEGVVDVDGEGVEAHVKAELTPFVEEGLDDQGHRLRARRHRARGVGCSSEIVARSRDSGRAGEAVSLGGGGGRGGRACWSREGGKGIAGREEIVK